MSVTDDEFARQRAERRRLHELRERMHKESETAIRTVLDEHCPSGIPEGLVRRLCLIQNELILEITENEKAIRVIHDGIHRLTEEAAGKWLDGFYACADQVRTHAAEANLPPDLVDSLLRNDQRHFSTAREERNAAASKQVQWTRG